MNNNTLMYVPMVATLTLIITLCVCGLIFKVVLA
jgi:hypothetical protein